MDNHSGSLKSVLKSHNSPKRNFLNVSFKDHTGTSDSPISFGTIGTPIYNWFLKSSPSPARDFSDHSSSSSSSDGLSVEEITCLDVDDILPKTDYTYARTASYSPKYLRKKRYISPNMSRRRLNGPQSSFLSDDEDDYEKEYDNDVVITKSENVYFDNDSEKLVAELNSERQSRPRKRSDIVTSSPLIHHPEYHISTHDHYYGGMLLRSGSHVKGARRALRGSSSNSSNGASYMSSSPVLAPTYRSDLDNDESHRKNVKTITTITTTTTDTSFDEDENRYIEAAADSHSVKKLKKRSHADFETYQKSQDFGDSEMKLQMDETETEKVRGKGRSTRLRHLDGLDYEEDISDVDDIGSAYYSKRQSAYRPQQASVLSRISSFFIMVVTTITTTIAESTSEVISPVAAGAFSTLTSPVRWIGRAIISTCSWILWSSSSVLLWDIEAKQRRRRGCCFCFLPFILLLPWFLLAGFYSGPVKEQVGSYLSTSQSMMSSYWTNVWNIRPTPVFIPPSKPTESHENHQMDMTQLEQHIHQTILRVMGQQQKEQPQGLTAEQVENIVKTLLASQVDATRQKFDSDISSLNNILIQDISNVRSTLSDLEKEVHDSGQSAKVVAGDLNAAKVSFESLSKEQRAEWLAVAEMMEGKLLDMRNEVNEVTNQNLVMAAKLKSCCQNDSMIMGAVDSHLATFFAEIDKDKDSAAVAGLMSLFGKQFVERDELEGKLSAVSADIAEKIRIALAKQTEEFQAMQAMQTRADKVSQETTVHVTGNLDELVVKSIVEDALLKFSADGIGMPDFALESAGGSVLNIRCSETYYRKTALISVFGLPLWYTSNSPRTVIQPSVHPGECWAFKGVSGFLVVQLSQPIQPTGFSLEHIPRSLAPAGNIDSAPQTFSVYGLTADNDVKGINLGNYTYLDTGRPIQHFPVQNRHPGVFQYVELRVLSNYGNVDYTCVYRFRVHGLP